MDTFKVPALPSSSSKRKFDDLPPPEILKKYKPNVDDEDMLPPRSTSNGKQRATVEDFNEDDDMEGSYGQEPEGVYNEDEDDEGRMFGGGLNEDQRTILDLFDAAGDDDDAPSEVTIPALRKMLVQFERVVKKNQEMRVKFPDDPEKFIDSESSLDSSLHSLTSTLPQNPGKFYPELVRSGTVNLLVELLAHENTDIALDVVGLLVELTEEDVGEADEDKDEEEEESAIAILVGALLELNIFELLVANLSRLDEKEEADRTGVFQTLGVFENLLSFDPTLADTLVKTTTCMKWLIERMLVEQYDSNKQYASEILAILLQQSRPNRLQLADLGGIDALLRVLSAYRKADPQDQEEEEFMENAFDALCSALAEPELKHTFLESEGTELMVICMKEKKMARSRSIKVLDHALSGAQGAPNCERFVEALGLKTLFAAFMGKGFKKALSAAEDTEHILGILTSLFTNLPSESVPRLRLLAKFVEDGYSKVDRLLDLRDEAEGRLIATERSIDDERQALRAEEIELDQEDEDMFYLRRLEGGLFTLQNIDFILAWLIMEDDGARDQAKLLLSRKDQTFQDIIDVLQEQRDNVGGSTAQTEDDRAGADNQVEILDGLMGYLKGSLGV